MFSDVVGYTAIMGRDEQEALRALEDHRELLRLLLPKFNGRMMGEIGEADLLAAYSEQAAALAEAGADAVRGLPQGLAHRPGDGGGGHHRG